MLSITIPKVAPWTEPNGLRYIQNGDALNTTNFGLEKTDEAAAFNWFFGVVTGQVAPVGWSRVATWDADNTFQGDNVFSGSQVFTGDIDCQSLATFEALVVLTSTSSLQFNGGATTPIAFSTHTARTRLVDINEVFFISGGSIAFGLTSGARTVVVTGTGTNFGFMLTDLKHGQKLTGVTVSFKGAPGDVGLPATKPTLQVFKVPLATAGTVGGTQIGSTATDAPANLAAYQAQHSLACTFAEELIDTQLNYYYAVVVAESGAGSTGTPSMIYYGATTTWNRYSIIE